MQTATQTPEKETRSNEGEFKIYIDPETGKKKIVGYAAVFNKKSVEMRMSVGPFREQIKPKAFNQVDFSNVVALYNHDKNMVLGSVDSKTLKIQEDDLGLRYEIDPPDTSFGNDLMKSIERGDVKRSSFSFQHKRDSWGVDDDGVNLRTIEKMDKVLDLGPVTFPAYPDTSAALRSLEQTKRGVHKLDRIKREIELLSII